MEDDELIKVLFLFGGGLITILIVMIGSIYALSHSRRKVVETEQEKARILVEEQNKLLRATIEGSERERKMISEELHDQINAQLTVVRMAVAQNGGDNSSALETLDATIQDLRSISRELMPPVLERFGLLDALDDLFDRVESQTGLAIEFEAPEEWVEFKVNRDLALYRILQEFIQNTLKYGQAKQICVKVDIVDNTVNFSITDDGVGFDMNAVDAGLGTRNIKSRVEYLNGSYKLWSEPGKGVSLQMTVPLED
ncbi:hypothetical protein GCM10011318_13640 [Phaeocystidibacter marisrubri]|nr:hypothetical protein GCM10011318_13640 [Phaeocystidibacter marisrubri]